ncbi:Gfo/Idh/MocA family protein [Streptomyces sp. NPDC054796]
MTERTTERTTRAATRPTEPLSVVLAGARGHGRWHLRNLRRLADEGVIRLAGICDVRPLPEEELAEYGFDAPADPDGTEAGGTRLEQSADFGALLDRTGADLAVLCTPIQTHTALALAAARRGVHQLLEKPPASSWSGYLRIAEAVRDSGTSCQVGFQSFGSHAVPAIRTLLDEGAIGAVRGIGAAGAWVRDDAYWRRAPWAGHRVLDGEEVMDGVLTNPLAHAVATALRLAGADHAEDVAGIELELYRANPIEADDTSCVRLRTTAGGEITAAVTLCAEENHEPYVVVHGEKGRITLWYKQDRVLLERDGHEPETTEHPRTDLLEDLAAHVRDRAAGRTPRPLLAPLERAGAFMRLVEAVRTAPEPLPLPGSAWEPAPGRRVVTGIDGLTADSAAGLSLYSELRAPWAVPPLEVTAP